ncbi:MAG: M42 family metallopeptidase [Clostridiaceae bacterium]|nr:M42 family metallopeptidase [Clostridiaceae bacterium]
MIRTLIELTKIDGVSGDEEQVRKYIEERVEKYGLEHMTDTIGNLIVRAGENSGNLKVMLAAHMDEVGLIINHITDDGKLKFAAVGGFDTRILTGQHVRIGDSKIPGVIGYKSIHLQEKKERESAVKLKDLYIDIGAKDREDAEKYIKLGDFAAFSSEPVFFGKNRLKAKALDDRAGCAVLLELVKEKWPFELYACFTVQEEVGLRGATVAAKRVAPDIAVVIEGTTCADVPEVSGHEISTEIGKGPALTFIDRTAIADSILLRHFESTAKKESIPFQWKQTVSGGNDAGKIQVSGSGVRVIAVSVPCRYIHSPVSVLDIYDLENTKELVKKALLTLPLVFDGRQKND